VSAKINERSIVMRSRHVPTGSRSPLYIACMLPACCALALYEEYLTKTGGAEYMYPVNASKIRSENLRRKFAAEILGPSGWASVANENKI
jgi:hypothetical protein